MLVQGLDGSAVPVVATLGGKTVVAHQAPDPAPVPAPATTEPSAEELHAAADQANRALAALSMTIEFEVDPGTKTTVVKVIDTRDQSVVRQVPSQEMLEISRALDRVQSLLFHAVA